jgi:hypothetical protein
MANLTAATSLRQVSPGPVAEWQAELYAGQKLYGGGMVCRRTADGYAVKAGTAGTGRVLGIAKADTATCVASGDTNVNLLTGQFIRPCHATHTPGIGDIGKAVYASDDSTISNLPSDGPIAGILVGFEDGSGDAIFYIEPPDAAAAGLGSLQIPFTSGILAAGTPMAAFADNASSQPGVTLVDSKAMGIRWNNNATQVAVWTRFILPRDIDTSKDATLVLTASKTGATGGDATKFTVTAFNNATGALDDADTDFGGDSSAMTGAATAKTVQQVTLTLAAADLGVGGDPVSLSFKPKDGTLGTDDVVLLGMELQYRKKS